MRTMSEWQFQSSDEYRYTQFYAFVLSGEDELGNTSPVESSSFRVLIQLNYNFKHSLIAQLENVKTCTYTDIILNNTIYNAVNVK